MLYHKRPQTIGDLLKVANSYADSEEADRQYKNNVARASRSDRPTHRDDDRHEEWRYGDHGRRYDDREHRLNYCPEGSRAAQLCLR